MGWLGCERARAHALLRGAPPTAAELQPLAEGLGTSEEEFQFGNLLSGIDVLQENLRFLLDGLEHGRKGEIAERVGVYPQTLSGWTKGKSKSVREDNLRKLKQVFGLADRIDLKREALFLSPDPVGELELRQWLKQGIDELETEELRALYPALRKLLSDV
jgi:transcriptional regulator with XRE-family HTH domain